MTGQFDMRRSESSTQDVSTNGPTDVYDGKCLLVGVWVDTDIATANVVFKDNTTAKVTVPSGIGLGWHPMGNIPFDTKLVIDPDDSATGNLTVVYAPFYS